MKCKRETTTKRKNRRQNLKIKCVICRIEFLVWLRLILSCKMPNAILKPLIKSKKLKYSNSCMSWTSFTTKSLNCARQIKDWTQPSSPRKNQLPNMLWSISHWQENSKTETKQSPILKSTLKVWKNKNLQMKRKSKHSRLPLKRWRKRLSIARTKWKREMSIFQHLKKRKATTRSK